jgi:PTH1 family peptidyl-tRNA hydrolase
VSWWRRILRLVFGHETVVAREAEPPMKLVVGLGNHGREYAGTRHNVGYEVVDRLAEQFGPADFRRQFSGRLASVKIADEKVWLLKPETYMNLSGQSVQPALAFYDLTPADLLVICDDLHLPVGKLRVRRAGSDGGQKGLRSIAERLSTTEYPRLRIGIGSVPQGRDAADFVLDRFTRDDRKRIDDAIDQAVAAVARWVEAGIEKCMNEFN